MFPKVNTYGTGVKIVTINTSVEVRGHWRKGHHRRVSWDCGFTWIVVQRKMTGSSGLTCLDGFSILQSRLSVSASYTAIICLRIFNEIEFSFFTLFNLCHISLKKIVGNVILNPFKHETFHFCNPTWSSRMRDKAGKYCKSITVMWHCYMQALHQCDLFAFCFAVCVLCVCMAHSFVRLYVISSTVWKFQVQVRREQITNKWRMTRGPRQYWADKLSPAPVCVFACVCVCVREIPRVLSGILMCRVGVDGCICELNQSHRGFFVMDPVWWNGAAPDTINRERDR